MAVKLNIGCGPSMFPYPGWINYDKEDFNPFLSWIVNVTNPKGYQVGVIDYIKNGGVFDFRHHDLRGGFAHHHDGSVDSIYLGQMIEHLNPVYEVPGFLAECFRMLRPGGVVRVVTPDIDLLINAYKDGRMDEFMKDQPDFYKNALPSDQLAYLMYGASGPKSTWTSYEGHMHLYTPESMAGFLERAGFSLPVYQYTSPGESQCPHMKVEVEDFGLSHSFITEAVR